MQSTGFRRGRGLFALLCAAWVQACPADAPRVAVVNKDADATFTDLVFERLSRSPGLELVERDKLRAVAGELALGARGGDVRAGTLLGAQGLLFVQTDDNLRHFTLVETSRGERLFDLVRPRAEAAGPEVVEQVCGQVLLHLPQLTGAGRAARHLAVMPFEREDGRTPRWPELNALTVLVGSMLARHPRIIVVERANLADLAFEPALAAGVSNTLASADAMLRGAAGRTESGGLRVHLRLNPSRGGAARAMSLDVAGDDLADGARRILAWVASELAPGAELPPVDTRAEAALQHERAAVFRARGRPDPLHYFQVAHELEPSNARYATSYRDFLQKRLGEPASVGLLCRHFLEVLKVQRRIDPGMKAGILPAPDFLRTVGPRSPTAPPSRLLPGEEEILRETRAETARFYRDY